jgi:hypothetical protein
MTLMQQPAHMAALDALSGLQRLWDVLLAEGQLLQGLALMALCVALVAVATAYLCKRGRPVYLLNYCVYKPPDAWKCPSATFLQNSRQCGAFDAQSMAFQEKMIAHGGLGEETYLPPGELLSLGGCSRCSRRCMHAMQGLAWNRRPQHATPCLPHQYTHACNTPQAAGSEPLACAVPQV